MTSKEMLTSKPFDILRKIIFGELKEKVVKEPRKTIFSDLNSSLELPRTRAEKIKLEKRRRHQAYMALDYSLSAITYFDYFSSDTFKIVKSAKFFAQICNKKVTSELLLLSFFVYPSEVSSILGEFKITKQKLEKIASTLQKQKEPSFFHKQKQRTVENFRNLKNFFIKEKLTFNSNVKYSHEVNLLLEKAAENALTRFKTPVITAEILFITVIEEKNTRASKMIRQFLKDDVQWYLLRYKLIKCIHYQESNLRSEVIKNQHYFAYLMKTQLSEFEFMKLIETEALSEGVALFRNTLISKVLEMDIFEDISSEISTSMKINKTRSYSV